MADTSCEVSALCVFVSVKTGISVFFEGAKNGISVVFSWFLNGISVLLRRV